VEEDDEVEDDVEKEEVLVLLVDDADVDAPFHSRLPSLAAARMTLGIEAV